MHPSRPDRPPGLDATERSLERRVIELEAALAVARAEVDRVRTHDELTGCLALPGLSKAFEALRAAGGPMVAILAECDDLSKVNDQFGHAIGDIVLREFAARIRSAMGGGDSLGRVGADRFVLLLVGGDMNEARATAERIRLAIASAPFAWEPKPVYLTASCGIVRVSEHAAALEEVLSIGRVALQKSRSRGGNRVSVPEDSAASAPWLTPVLRGFLAAIRGGEGLRLFGQPILALPRQVPVGWELLVRGPKGELESPAVLFQIAKEQHLTAALDMICLRMGAEAAVRSGHKGAFHLNILPSTLLEVEVENILELLADPPPGVRWSVELSERQFFGDPAELVEKTTILREHGVCVAIDDVGSGRGTLDCVVALEPELAKLDLRLVRGVAGNARQRRLLERMLAMTEALEVEVVAEGVEDQADLDVLLELGVRFAQGHLWGRPTPMRGGEGAP